MIIEAEGRQVKFIIENTDTHQLRRIMIDHLPRVLNKFARKNRQYGENDFELGLAAQFPEIWRKVNRLRAIIWDGRKDAEEFEDAEEVVHDFIGHCLMLLDAIQRKRAGGYSGPIPPVEGSRAEALPGPTRGNGTYLVVDLIARARGHSLEMSEVTDKQCPWHYGDDAKHYNKRCVGIELHEASPDRKWHINRDGDAWR